MIGRSNDVLPPRSQRRGPPSLLEGSYYEQSQLSTSGDPINAWDARTGPTKTPTALQGEWVENRASSRFAAAKKRAAHPSSRQRISRANRQFRPRSRLSPQPSGFRSAMRVELGPPGLERPG